MTPVRSSRPGPRADLDVREILLDTAERVFAEQGIDAVSLRAIGRAAGVSSAGVLYHYPTKPALIAAVVRRRGIAFGRQIITNLQDLIDTERTVTVRNVVEAIAMPMINVIQDDPVAGLSWIKVVAQLAQQHDPIWVEAVTQPRDLTDLFAHAAVRVLPDYDSVSVRVRLGIAIYSMLTSLATADRAGVVPQYNAEDGLDPDFIEQLLRFTAAGVAAE